MMNYFFLKRMTKITLVLLAGICLLIFNVYRNSANFNKYEDSIESLYDDRLMAERIIMDFSSLLYGNLNILFSDGLSFLEKRACIAGNAKKMHDLITEFSYTWMTEEEQILFNDLSCQNLDFEQNINTGNTIEIKDDLNALHRLLNQLSLIQIKESDNILKESKTILGSSVLIYQINWALIIFILMMMYYFIVSEIRFRDLRIKTSPNLN